MFSLIFQASEEASESLASKIGFASGFFVYSNLIEILAVFLIIAALILYWTVFRKKDLDW